MEEEDEEIEDGNDCRCWGSECYCKTSSKSSKIPDDIEQDALDNLWSILSEFGKHSTTTKVMLDEYGKIVVKDDMINVISSKFGG